MSVNRLLLLLVSVLCCGAVIAKPQYTVQSEDGTPLDLGEPPRVQSEPVSMIFDNTPVLVNPGESLSLDCGLSGDYRYCHWDNGKQAAIQVQDVYDGYIDGLSKPAVTKGNECGIIVNSVNIQDHGLWTCKAFVIGQTLTGSKNVTVTIRPTNPVLEVPRRPLFVDEGDQPNIKCSVAAARPKAEIRWFLGEEDITYNSLTENTLEGNSGAYKSISTLSQMFNAWHNNKILRCVVFHYTLETPVDDYVDVSVRYKPWGKDVRLYGIKLGDDVEAKVNFSSNPVPTNIKWGYGLAFEDVVAQLPVPGEEGRYSTEMVQLEDGHYSVILRTLEFQEGDAHLSFKVSVENELGIRDFRVTISNDKPPNEPLSSGTLATIVIVVLLVILFLLCAVYMRYNHLYCFAAKKDAKEDKEANGTSDTESTQAPAVTNGQHKNGTKTSLFSKLHKKSKQSEKPAPVKPEETTTLPDKPADEVVYAELDLAPSDKKPAAAVGEKIDPCLDEGTEYAQIVGVLKNPDRKE